MQNLIGQTFSYNYRGGCQDRKVIAMVRIKGEAMYELLDPVTHKHDGAYVSIFNRIFKAHRGSVKKKGTKGKSIGNKQSFTA